MLHGQWIRATGPYAHEVGSIAVSAGAIFAGNWEGGVHRSTDSGSTWTGTSAEINDTQILSLANVGDTLFAGTNEGVFRSWNNGATWVKSGAGILSPVFSDLVIAGSKVFAARYGGVFRSKDSGASWKQVATGLSDFPELAL